MALSTTHTQVRYTGNGTTGPFTVTFQFLDKEDLIVTIQDAGGTVTVLALGTDYTVTGGDGTTGNISLVSTPDNTNTILIKRQTRLIQPVNLVTTGEFPPEAIERQLDRTMMVMQETVGTAAGRLLRVTADSAEISAVDATSPAGGVFGYDINSVLKLLLPAELLTLLSLPGEVINRPLALWTDDSQRASKVANYIGQVGVQSGDLSLWIANGLSAGNWQLVPLNDSTLGGGSPSARKAATQLAVKAYLDAATGAIATDYTTKLATLTGLIGEQGFVETPVGAIQPWAGGTSLPASYLLCDGSTVNRADYPDLFARLGTRWGSGNGSTTFHLPDFRGLFMRGRDIGIGRDTGAGSRTALHSGGAASDNVGSFQDNAFEAHTHGVTDPGHVHTSVNGHTRTIQQGGGTATSLVDGTPPANTANNTTGISLANAGGSETRPKNASVDFIIKALPLGVGNPDLQGWSPRFAIQNDGARRVLQLVDWLGGTINKPTGPPLNYYVGNSAMEALIANGVDIRGQAGEVEEAPNDGDLYARQNEAWTSFVPGIPDAPSDGALYVRKNGVWVELITDTDFGTFLNTIITGSGYVPEAPIDGIPYIRFNGTWIQDMNP